jgi:hypothetical protein
MRECEVNAEGGLRSDEILARAKPTTGLTIISAGTNDPRNQQLQSNLSAIRSKVEGNVIWILPANETARAAVEQIAASRGDKTVSFAPQPDGRHPASIPDLARDVRALKN